MVGTTFKHIYNNPSIIANCFLSAGIPQSISAGESFLQDLDLSGEDTSLNEDGEDLNKDNIGSSEEVGYNY